MGAKFLRRWGRDRAHWPNGSDRSNGRSRIGRSHWGDGTDWIGWGYRGDRTHGILGRHRCNRSHRTNRTQRMDDHRRKHNFQCSQLFNGRLLISTDRIELYCDTPDGYHSGASSKLF